MRFLLSEISNKRLTNILGVLHFDKSIETLELKSIDLLTCFHFLIWADPHLRILDNETFELQGSTRRTSGREAWD